MLVIGEAHCFVELAVMADTFAKNINNKKLWIFDKEECLNGLVKQLTRILSDWDDVTRDTVTTLHNARDKQVRFTLFF